MLVLSDLGMQNGRDWPSTASWERTHGVDCGVAIAAELNEIPATPVLLRLLVPTGCIVTIDAIGCKSALAQAIRAQGGELCVDAQRDQEGLAQAVDIAFGKLTGCGDQACQHSTHRELSKDHGRVEVRTTARIDVPTLLKYLDPDHAWVGLAGAVRVVAERRSQGRCSSETRYSLTSLTAARPVHHAVRSHWGMENSVHWVLAIAVHEDLCRVRTGHAAHHCSLLRRILLNLLRQDPTARCGIKARRLKAALDPAYLLATLNPSF